MPADVEKTARKQLERLKQMAQSSAEYTVQRTYLEWLVELPWSKQTEDRAGPRSGARRSSTPITTTCKKVKKRILEYLAVRKLAPGKKGPILCLVGPPGVGKTSLGKSIARSLGREFIRVSLGGVRDEAEIRGHRRTYIGALPGRVIQGMRRVGTRNPVFMLDEIDKLGADFRGDPVGGACSRSSTPSRTRRSRTTTSRSTSTCPTSSSSPRRTCWIRSRRRCSTAWRCWRSRATRARRSWRSPSATWCPSRSPSTASTTTQIGSRRRDAHHHHRAVHARGGRAQSRARGRQRHPRHRGQGGREPGLRSEPDARGDRRHPRAAEVLLGGRPSARRSRAWPPGWPGCRRAATSCSSRPRRWRARAT